MNKLDASRYKRTKIIATIGPASELHLESLLRSGVNGMRLNFSHNRHSWHANVITQIRQYAEKLNRSVAIIQDLQGPKIRVGVLPSTIEVKAGDELKFRFDADYAKTGIIPIQFDFSPMVKKGDRVYIRDGAIISEVMKVREGVVTVIVRSGGKFGGQHGINLPDTVINESKLTEKDLKDLAFGLKHDIDYVAISFVHTAHDVEHVRSLIAKSKKNIKIITKIETAPAVQNLHSIIEASDAVMIARGDLATETSPEEVPIIGREIINIARRMKRPVIMATQMLESMTTNPEPTRAEANDVATAVSLGVDAVMLSGETAVGSYPVDTVKMMKRIILSTEQYLSETNQYGSIRMLTAQDSPQDAVCMAAITLANHLSAKLILAETLTGSTALAIASHRPNAAIIMASPDERVCNQCSIVWGGKPFRVPKTRIISPEVIRAFVKRGALKSGDTVVSAFGTHSGTSGGTDTVRLIGV
ncbi:pyruvate kinase [Candidatus Saccharibacteria bacterium]|nr:pyruvate kinase [Candidatus Saccharibacteria bacterium]